MSAIIAGEACKECGERYWYTLGHPKWFNDVVKRNMEPGEDFKAFIQWRNSGKCRKCYFPEDEEDN